MILRVSAHVCALRNPHVDLRSPLRPRIHFPLDSTESFFEETCLPSSIVLPVLLAAALFAPLKAATVSILDFEDLPEAYFFSSGGQNIGSYYSGIDFGANVTGLSVSRFGGYDSAAFPPHSGDVDVWDPVDLVMTITFESPLQSVGFWYTSYDPLTLRAYDSGDNLLGLAVGGPNTDGTTGTSSFISIQARDIRLVAISSSPGLYVLDDLTIDTGTSGVPEPSAAELMLIGIGYLVIVRKRRDQLRPSPGRSEVRRHAETKGDSRWLD